MTSPYAAFGRIGDVTDRQPFDNDTSLGASMAAATPAQTANALVTAMPPFPTGRTGVLFRLRCCVRGLLHHAALTTSLSAIGDRRTQLEQCEGDRRFRAALTGTPPTGLVWARTTRRAASCCEAR